MSFELRSEVWVGVCQVGRTSEPSQKRKGPVLQPKVRRPWPVWGTGRRPICQCARGTEAVGRGAEAAVEAGVTACRGIVSRVNSLDFIPHFKSQQTFIHVYKTY